MPPQLFASSRLPHTTALAQVNVGKQVGVRLLGALNILKKPTRVCELASFSLSTINCLLKSVGVLFNHHLGDGTA